MFVRGGEGGGIEVRLSGCRSAKNELFLLNPPGWNEKRVERWDENFFYSDRSRNEIGILINVFSQLDFLTSKA